MATKTIRLKIPGRPIPQPRTRSARNGHHYTPGKTVGPYKAAIRQAAMAAGCKIATLPVRIVVWLTFKRPKSHFLKSGAVKPSAPDIPGQNLGDTDNIGKAVKDSLKGLAYVDDSRVFDDRVIKAWGDSDLTEVTIEEVPHGCPR